MNDTDNEVLSWKRAKLLVEAELEAEHINATVNEAEEDRYAFKFSISKGGKTLRHYRVDKVTELVSQFY